MPKLSLVDLIQKLTTDNINVLVLDTCCLLDIIRSPYRQQTSILEAGMEISELLNQKKLNYNLIIPSIVPLEWKNNVDNECKNLRNEIKKAEDLHKVLSSLIDETHSVNILPLEIPKYTCDDSLKKISQNILNNSYNFDSTNELNVKAGDRVKHGIAPADSSKQSFKDSLIFEEVLEIADNLRKVGFTKKIIFATSNTSEYYDRSPTLTLKKRIVSDITPLSVQLVNSLDWGHHEAKN